MSGKKGFLVFAAVAGLLSAGAVGCASKGDHHGEKKDDSKMEKNSCKGGGKCKEGGKCKSGGQCKEGGKCKAGGGCGKNSCG